MSLEKEKSSKKQREEFNMLSFPQTCHLLRFPFSSSINSIGEDLSELEDPCGFLFRLNLDILPASLVASEGLAPESSMTYCSAVQST